MMIPRATLETYKALAEQLRLIEQATKTIRANTPPAVFGVFGEFEKVREKIRELSVNAARAFKKMPESVKHLAENGWYMSTDSGVGDTNHLASELKNGNFEIVDQWMMESYDHEIESIEKRLIDLYPHRAPIIRSAIKAHVARDYYLSTPVFFTQVEGICNEIIGTNFFSSRKSKPLTAQWANENQTDSIMNALLEPLRIKGKVRENQISELPVDFNRHDIVHGNSISYGENPVNSYKALSLLNYIGLTIYEIKKMLDEKK